MQSKMVMKHFLIIFSTESDSFDIFFIPADISKISSLIGQGVNVNQRFDNGQTPIHMAPEKSNHFQSSLNQYHLHEFS